MSEETYTAFMREEIAKVIRAQEELDIDVLVHGEPERNDMVEYFADMLEGFAFTENGWVQSYGSRCVKPPVIFGDIARKKPMTIDWIQYAQSLSKRPVKGMLTGPVTMLQWAFVRDDQPREKTAYAMALALRDEVDDLVKAGIRVIQIDEPAFREGLPLKRSLWDSYTQWAAKAFRLSAAVALMTCRFTRICVMPNSTISCPPSNRLMQTSSPLKRRDRIWSFCKLLSITPIPGKSALASTTSTHRLFPPKKKSRQESKRPWP